MHIIDTHVQVRLVDEAGADAGAADKLAAHSAGGRRHRAFSAFLFTPDGRLLLQQRATVKYHWPGVWSNSCCGHPATRDTAIDDARVRIREELGLVVSDLREAAIVEYRFQDPDTGLTEWEVNHVLFGVTDAVPDPDPDEVDAVRCVDAAELAELMRELGVSAWFPNVFGPLVSSAAFTATDLAPQWDWWTCRVRATDVADFVAAVDRVIAEQLDDSRWAHIPYADSPISPAALARRLHAAGGKRMRPLLVLYGMLLVGADTDDLERAVPVAAAVELLHLFGLLQDDIMDNATLRRGLPTATIRVLEHRGDRIDDAAARRHGDALAMLAGDLCAGVADELVDTEHPALRALWAKSLQELVVAQYADITAATVAENDPSILRRIASLKSGRYSIYLPLVLGVLLARPDTCTAAFDQACEDLGVAFQLADDLRDHHSPEITGKDQHLDTGNGRTTYADVVADPAAVRVVINTSIATGLKRLRDIGCDAQRVEELRQLLIKVTA
ncbi:isopentenyl-diphosphate Delta-isomerase [Nocardia sp. NPDC020380]|uniref:isopentenyl-diphosphate Delta-isomerase n=1 Tax=Nocardia sp. NPDC020380 TaxID=3364309 RepID=UPI0037B9D642